jgi:cytochrome c oxidase subunit III
MSVILVFLVVVMGFSGWWLVTRQGLTDKPWLEVGAGADLRPRTGGTPTPKLALAVFLAVVGALFALFVSAYFMRMEFVDWRPMPVPRIVWLSTGMLILASVALQCALVASRSGEVGTLRLGIATATVATMAFLLGQLLAWRDLMDSGFLITGNPSNAFFYVMTGLHGLHILGGLLAMARVAPEAWEKPLPADLGLRLELCTMYWHFLLLVWIGLFVLLVGWANQFVVDVVNICRQLLS